MRSRSSLALLSLVAGGALVALYAGIETRTPRAVAALQVDDPVVASASFDGPSNTALARHESTPARRRERRLLDPLTPLASPASAVAGWVDLANGLPASCAWIALFPVTGDFVALEPAAEVECRDGVFSASTKQAGLFELVAYAPGARPVARRITLEPAQRLELEPLALDVGASVTGRVLACDAPLARVEIQAALDRPRAVLTLGGGSLARLQGRYEWALASGRSDEHGDYVIAGLAVAAHHVRVAAVRGGATAIDGTIVGAQDIVTPATHVDFPLALGHLEFQFFAGGVPIPGVEVELTFRDRYFTRISGEDGRLELCLTPAREYAVRASRGGYLTKHTKLSGVVDGESRVERIELVPHDDATVEITFTGADPGDEVELRFLEESAYLKGRFVTGGETFARQANAEEDARTFVVPAIPAGNYRVVARTGALRVGGGKRDFTNCEAEFKVRVPASGKAHAIVPIQARGRIALSVKDPAGRLLAAACTTSLTRIHEPEARTFVGEYAGPTESRLFVQGEKRGEARESTSTLQPTQLLTTLCEGVVELSVTAPGFVGRVTSVKLVPGQVEQVELTLQPL